MGEWNGKTMLESTDDQILDELRKNEPNHHQSVALEKAIAIRNNQRLAGAITAASRAGRFLAWVVAAATVVSAAVEASKFLFGK
jgi:hypothetical protein